MNKFFKQYNMKPGDEVVVPKNIIGIINHHALYIGFDNAGIEWMIENKKGDAVRLVKANVFFNNIIKIDRIQQYAGNNINRKNLVRRALSKIGQPYNLINYNCEHFVTEVTTGQPVSRQVQNAVWGLLGIVVLSSLIGDNH